MPSGESVSNYVWNSYDMIWNSFSVGAQHVTVTQSSREKEMQEKCGQNASNFNVILCYMTYDMSYMSFL